MVWSELAPLHIGNAVGGAILDRFVTAIQEVADARSMLQTQVGACLVDNLGEGAQVQG